jgi:hypothetical protein
MSTTKKPDYRARHRFLEATTAEMKPAAPIDTLIEHVEPVFRSYWDQRASRLPFGNTFAMVTPTTDITMAGLEDEPLRSAIESWMSGYRFRDEWIGDAALSTLQARAVSGGNSRHWTWWEPEDLRPEGFALPVRGGESISEYHDRLAREVARRRNIALADLRLQTGTNTDFRDPMAPTMVAMHFTGWTFTVIAAHYNESIDQVSKTIRRFSERAGLTLPL